MEKKYKVYKHTCPNGKCYIGITSQSTESRWKNGRGYDTQLFGKAVRKYGWENIEHEILFDGLSLDEAYQKEIELIFELQSYNPLFGYNCDLGGAGSSGHFISDEQREKMRERSKEMWKDPKTREHLLKHLAEISKENIGRKRTQEAISKTKDALSIPVLQYNKQFELVAEHPSLMDAARNLNKNCNNLISRVCKQKHKTAYGYYWRYKDDPITENEIVELSKPKLKYNAKTVEQYSKDGKLVARYDSLHEADRQTGFSYKMLWIAATGKRPSAYGYIWKFV